MTMNEKRQPRELLLSAIEHFDNAQEAFELARYGLGGRDEVAMTKFSRLRDVILEALAPVFVPPADPDDEPYNIAEDRFDALKEAFDLTGPSSALSATAARAFADAADLAVLDFERRKAEGAAETLPH